MYNGKKILAIIPARGGSKGLPGKNIRPLLGKPLIGWSIEQAQASKYVDEIFVSTDCQEIAAIARQFGVVIPELRPSELATDIASSAGFILHTIKTLADKKKIFDYIVLIEPTSPLRDVEDIDNAIKILIDSVEESIVGVCKSEVAHPDYLVRISSNGLLCPYRDNMESIRRQDLDELFFFEGSIYVSNITAFIEKKSFYHDKTLPYIVPKWKSFEIDDFIDFKIVETIMSLKLNKELK